MRRFGNVSAETEQATQREWSRIMGAVERFLRLGHSRSFELPKHNDIWHRDATQEVLNRCGLQFCATVFLCQTGSVGRTGLPINKQLKFVSNKREFLQVLEQAFGRCTCAAHEPMLGVNWAETAFYNTKLARVMLNGVKTAATEQRRIVKHQRDIQRGMSSLCASVEEWDHFS